MRDDALGMFWQDEPVIKKEKIKKVPPPRTWDSPDFLPYFSEAVAFDIPQYTDDELVTESFSPDKERLVFDIESYSEYFCIGFKGVRSGKIFFIDCHLEEGLGFLSESEVEKIKWVLKNFTVVSFNGINYDIPILTLALNYFPVDTLKYATNLIITGAGEGAPMRPYDILKKFKVKQLKGHDHIDLMEVAPLDGSLKIYSGRLHCRRVQDLPYSPDSSLTKEQRLVVRWYCLNDLENTVLLYKDLLKAIELREQIGIRYGVDLRSKSDAQIAESIISKEIHTATGALPKRPADVDAVVGTTHLYKVPNYIVFTTDNMKWVLEAVKQSIFIVGASGRIVMPELLSDLEIPIGSGVYRMGIGGLHSSEKTIAHKADENTLIVDRDVASYYPRVILNLGLYPSHLGPIFLSVYNNIVNRRLEAKTSGDELTAKTLKITVNGSFGKTGNKYSLLYEPSLVIQTTITGQLSLLMLIERLYLAGFIVLSANTDGIVTKVNKNRKGEFDEIIKKWEADTGFETEEALYRALYSRDVNNYIAVKETNKTDSKDRVKLKGAYGWADLRKTPQNEICNEAVVEYILNNTPIASTVMACKDITKFVTLRKVRTGAVKDGFYLGSTVRWYYANGVEGVIVVAASGNNVPKSEGAKPIPDLPTEFPSDINYDWYINECYSILEDINAINKVVES